MCVNNLPRVALDSGEAGIRLPTYWSQVQRPYPSATEPHAAQVYVKYTSRAGAGAGGGARGGAKDLCFASRKINCYKTSDRFAPNEDTLMQRV